MNYVLRTRRRCRKIEVKEQNVKDIIQTLGYCDCKCTFMENNNENGNYRDNKATEKWTSKCSTM